jgi:quinolinate synthase
MPEDVLGYIKKRTEELNAIIVAHYYQPPEIQDVADFVGDSLQLARKAATTRADIIVFCGVRFMAESAKILSPEKTVILPEIEAGCPMADMITAAELRDKKAAFPDALVVCYVNSSAEVKAESDICCTSSNAIKVVESIPEKKKIIFVPDRNLGTFIQDLTGREMILWDGYCPVHDVLQMQEIEGQRALHPKARVIVHPECPPAITRTADAVCSTAGILEFVQNSPDNEFIIGTEKDFLYTLEKNCPGKAFYAARQYFECRDMKYIPLDKLALSLEKLQYQIEVPEDIRKKAYGSLERMISI